MLYENFKGKKNPIHSELPKIAKLPKKNAIWSTLGVHKLVLKI